MAALISVRVTENRFPELASRFPGATYVLLGRTAQAIAGFAQAGAPHVTGELAGSIHADGLGSESPRVVVDAPYARFVEFGRGPVHPVNAKVLHFFVDGAEVFTRYAGPAAPEPFLAPAVQQGADWLAANAQALEGLLG